MYKPPSNLHKNNESTKYTGFTIFSEHINNGTEVITSVPRRKKATKEKNKESYNTKWMHTITNMTTKKIQILLIPMADTWFCTHRGKMFFHFKHRCNFCVCTRWKWKIKFGPPCWCRCSEDANELDLEAPQIQAAFRAPVRFGLCFYSFSSSFYWNDPMLCVVKNKTSYYSNKAVSSLKYNIIVGELFNLYLFKLLFI